MALLITACDERVKVCAAAHPGGSMEQTFLTGRRSAEAEILSLIPPRPCAMVVGRDSGEAPGHQAKLDDMLRFYRGLGADASRGQMFLVDGVHDMKPPKRVVCYAWLNKWLDQEQEGADEPPLTPETVADLHCTATGLAVRDLDGQTGQTLNARVAERLRPHIVDTALLLAGAVAALSRPLWGPRLGAWCMAAAAVYLLVCAAYHHQALDLARRIFPDVKPGEQNLAALPQPFSSRRWQLIAAGPADIYQTFVQLPFEAALGLGSLESKAAAPAAGNQAGSALPAPYQAPGQLTVQTWKAAPAAAAAYSPEAEAVLAGFLEFARFPLLSRAESQGGAQLMEWRDLRFSIPGRAFPFVLQLRLDDRGRLQHWLLGRRQE